ncbi:MAG TPA: hypothetical protein VMY78_10635 [Solirubrobacteraceae bacterium]|nr:hypothetical protein [Solirubrobacteraceae bacterium]
MTVTALGAGAGAVASPVQAQLLGGLLPNLGTIVTGTGTALGNTLNSILPGTGAVVTGVTGTVGGVVGGVQNTVTGVVDQTLGGVLDGGAGGLLPTDVLDSLLGTLLANSSAAPGTPGTGTSGGPIVLAGGSVTPGGIVLDASAPRPTVKVLSTLKKIGKDGKMRMEIRTNEPGIVAVAGSVRPGVAVKKKGAKAVKHSRKVIKVPSITLGYRKAGKLVVTVKLSRAAQRALGRSKDARMSVGTLASDVFRNQDSDNFRLKIKR